VDAEHLPCFRYSYAEFREQHRHIVLEYMQRGHEFGRDEWRQAIIAFDLLKKAMNQATIDTISQQAFDQAIEQYISWASVWDGALPADVFFPTGMLRNGVWADLKRQERPVELHARIVKGHLQLAAAPESPIRVRDNRIYLEDGRELVIQLDAV
jgi:hypothetical protein